jgi:hypothetical protein
MDARSFAIRIAGVAALLVAKLHKIAERKDIAARRQDKDGLDVLRMLRFANTDFLAATLDRLMQNPVAGVVSQEARTLLGDLFGDRDAPGAQMAARASVGLEDHVAITLSCEVLARRLLEAWKAMKRWARRRCGCRSQRAGGAVEI